MSSSAEPEYTEHFADVQQAEGAWLRARRIAAGCPAGDASVVGLALSGGGIRSAAFNMGVLQALSHSGLLPRVDYLSTVSGGGYIGSCLSWLRAHVSVKEAVHLGAIPLSDGTGTVLDWLRAHGRYLITGKGLSGWALAASILSGALLNLFVLVPWFLLLIAAASAGSAEFGWPSQLELPGAPHVTAHVGFLAVAAIGVVALALYLLSIVAFALSTVLPPLRQLGTAQLLRRRMGQLLAGAAICIGVGLLPVLVGIEDTVLLFVDSQALKGITHHATWIAPLLSGLLSIYQANKRGAHASTYGKAGIALVLAGMFTLLYHLADHAGLLSSALFWDWLVLSLLLALVCDINAISMHSYYRSRLAEAFMPAVGTRRDDRNHPLSFRLASLSAAAGAPFHIINTTLNTRSSADARLRARNGENMILTPLYCGSASTGYRRTSHYLRGELALSTAFSVSGAAVDPDTFATRSRPVSFLMTLLNIRLGLWVPNPRHPPRRFRLPAWYGLMVREMLGTGLSERSARIHLSDGGHFENLGVYELLRRRCRYIIVCDAGEDPAATLADLGQAVQRARADLDAEIDICADPLFHGDGHPMRKRAHLVGNVAYADGSRGEILYLKALITGDLDADVYGYWRTNPEFPDQSTSNQFYGELQFDSYRELGRQLMTGIVGHGGDVDIEQLFARWRAQPPA